MIRPATPNDTPAIAPLIISAMGGLAAQFANSTSVVVQTQLFEHFVEQPENQYSYQNILVYEDESGICGMIMAYDGACLEELRRPFLHYTRTQLGFSGNPEDETRAGEYYIDCLSVKPERRGRGIAKILVKALLEKASRLGHEKVGLLVNNADAKRLYINLGFVEKERITLLGGLHDHMQIQVAG